MKKKNMRPIQWKPSSPKTETRITLFYFQTVAPPDFLKKKKNQHMNDAFTNTLVFT